MNETKVVEPEEETGANVFRTSDAYLSAFLEIKCETLPVYKFNGPHTYYVFPMNECIRTQVVEFHNRASVECLLFVQILKKNKAVHLSQNSKKEKKSAKVGV